MKFPPVAVEVILDSRGVPTLMLTADFEGQPIIAKIPSGTSTGTFEARYLPAEKVVDNLGEVNDFLKGTEFNSLSEFDQAIRKKDGTVNKGRWGANLLLGLSMLYCRIDAVSKNLQLHEWLKSEFDHLNKNTFLKTVKSAKVTPMMVMVEGGVHAQSGPYFQEILINGKVADGEAVWRQLEKKGHALGLEGGFDIPYPDRTKSNEQGLEAVRGAIREAEVTMSLSVDVAANQIPEDQRLRPYELIPLIRDFKIQTIEDPFCENDWSAWSQLVKELAFHRLSTAVIGDDLTVTQTSRLEEALEKKALTGVIVKPNQVGTITETLEFVRLARQNNCVVIVSHRSGETDDTFIADLAAGVKADYLKSGAPSRPERIVKYQRLATIQGGA